MIQSYFAQIKAVIDQYTAANFVLDSSLSFETRPGDQGYLHGVVVFVYESRFFFREYLDVSDATARLGIAVKNLERGTAVF